MHPLLHFLAIFAAGATVGAVLGLAFGPRLLRWATRQVDALTAPTQDDIVEELRRGDVDLRAAIADRNRARQEAAELRRRLDDHETKAIIRRPGANARTVEIAPTPQAQAGEVKP